MKNITWINVLLGIWLIIAPFAITRVGTGAGAWTVNDVVLGILLIAFSWWIVGAIAPPSGAAWFEVLCGIWLIVAPFVLRYSGAPRHVSNDVISGIIAIVVAAIAVAGMHHARPPRVTA